MVSRLSVLFLFVILLCLLIKEFLLCVLEVIILAAFFQPVILLLIFKLNGLALIMIWQFVCFKVTLRITCCLMTVCCIIFLLMMMFIWIGLRLRRFTEMPSNYFLPALNYYCNFPTYKQIKAWSGILEDEAPDELYHFSVKDFHCCIVRNVRSVTDKRDINSAVFTSAEIFGSYSVRVLGMPPKVGIWQSYYTGDFYNAVAKFRELVQNYLNGNYSLD